MVAPEYMPKFSMREKHKTKLFVKLTLNMSEKDMLIQEKHCFKVIPKGGISFLIRRSK